MTSFPSQTPRSPYSRFLRIGIIATSAMIFVASLVGFAYALWPAKDLVGQGYAEGTGAVTAGYRAVDPGVAGSTYGNGKIPLTELTAIAPGHYLDPVAAEAFARMKKSLAADGHKLQVNSAYRTLAEQEGLIKRYGLLNDGGTAAPVGESDHGLGLSVDLKLDGNDLRWMGENADAYGFKNTVKGEPWHWTFVGNSR